MGTQNHNLPKPIFGGSIWVLLSSITITTLYFNTKLLDPFNSPKLVIVIISSAWLFGHLILSYRSRRIELKSTEALILIICVTFMISLTTSLLMTDVTVVGLIGESQRRNGYLAYLSLIIIFLYSSRFINSFQILKFFKVSIAVGLLLGIYGIMQISGKDFVVWNNPYNSMIATVGNPNFASALLAILVLLATSSLLQTHTSNLYKILAILFIILALISIVRSNSRQGLIVVGFGYIFYLSISLLLNKSRFKFYVLPILIFIFLLSILGMLQKGPLAQYLYKDSVSVRGFYWRAGFKMFQDNPIFGVGLDRYGSSFKLWREPEYPLRYGFDITSSNAHNTFIQLFATGGIFVGLSYLILIIAVFIIGIKLVQNSPTELRPLNLGVLTAYFGFQCQSFISIDNIGVSIWGWVLGGAIVGLFADQKSKLAVNNKNSALNKKSTSSQVSLLQPLVSAIVLIPAIWVSSLLLQMESKSYEIRVIIESGAVEQNRELVLQKVREFEINPISDPFYVFQGATSLVNAGYVKEAYEVVLKLNTIDPTNLYYLDWLARYHKTSNQINEEIKIRNQITKFDPWNAKNLFRLGELYQLSENNVLAKEYFNRIIVFAGKTDIANLARDKLAK
ncbi:MAG: hypothetical protein GM48_2450 [actinobacterium acIB-AMD-7]|nr:MAG: hypothetical protein GM48_2450 [actinobacterium acIB-AMD-7]